MFSAKSLNEIRSFMEEKLGVPGRDPWSLPTSPHTFPDGAHFRIEIAGVERASTLEAMVEEARKKKIIIHRAIATVGDPPCWASPNSRPWPVWPGRKRSRSS